MWRREGREGGGTAVRIEREEKPCQMYEHEKPLCMCRCEVVEGRVDVMQDFSSGSDGR